MGQGPMTGRGMGPCSGRGIGYGHYSCGGFGRARVRGFGRGFMGFPMRPEDQNSFLAQRQDFLEAELERIKELRGQSENAGGSMEAEA
jgi:hypothetical protein